MTLEPSRTVKISKWANHYSSTDITRLFSSCGEIESVTWDRDIFIQFAKKEHCDSAISLCNSSLVEESLEISLLPTEETMLEKWAKSGKEVVLRYFESILWEAEEKLGLIFIVSNCTEIFKNEFRKLEEKYGLGTRIKSKMREYGYN